MEDDIDIYEDLPGFNDGDNENIVEKNKELAQKCSDLEKKVANLTEKLESVQKINKNLEVNLASLLKTAQAEISRKDKMIADIRKQLDSLLFRRNCYNKRTAPNETKKKSESKKRSEPFTSETHDEYSDPDLTEYVCNNSLDVYQKNKGIKQAHRPDKVLSTVFGKRLQKRLLLEEEMEQKQKEQLNTAVSDVKSVGHIAENDKENSSKCNINSKENQSNSIPLSSDAENMVNTHDGEPNFSSVNGSNLLKNDNSEYKVALVNCHERKRSMDRQMDMQDCKRRKVEEHKDEYWEDRQCTSDKGRLSNRHNFENHDQAWHAKGISNKHKRKCNDICDNDEPFENMGEYQVFDKHKSDPFSHTNNDHAHICEKESTTHNIKKSDDSHNRIASRLRFLAEGIEPDFYIGNYTTSQQFKQAIDSKRDNRKCESLTSQSKNRDSDSRHDKSKHYRSRSRSSDRRYNDRRYNRNRYSRYKDSKDKYDKRRDVNNRNGDNSSEFNKEIHDLRDKIDYKLDGKDNSRNNSFNRSKKYQDKRCKDERGKSSDIISNDNVNDVCKSNVDDQRTKRSRSHEKRSSQTIKERSNDCNANLTKSHKSNIISKIEKGHKEISDMKKAAETISLQSLEDGEIADTPNSSPRKIVGIDLQISAKLDVLPELKLKNSNKIDLNVDKNKSIIVTSADNAGDDFSRNKIIENSKESIRNDYLDKNSEISLSDISQESTEKEICKESANSMKNVENVLYNVEFSNVVTVENSGNDEINRREKLNEGECNEEKLSSTTEKNLKSVQLKTNISEKTNVIPSIGDYDDDDDDDTDRCKKNEPEMKAEEECLKESKVLKSADCLTTAITRRKRILRPVMPKYSRNRKATTITSDQTVNHNTVQGVETNDSLSVNIIDNDMKNVGNSESNSDKEMKVKAQTLKDKPDRTNKCNLADPVKSMEHTDHCESMKHPVAENISTKELNSTSVNYASQSSDQTEDNIENGRRKSNDNYSKGGNVPTAKNENTVIKDITCSKRESVKKIVEHSNVEDCEDKNSNENKETIKGKAQANCANSETRDPVLHKKNQEVTIRQDEPKKTVLEEKRKAVSKEDGSKIKDIVESDRLKIDTSKCVQGPEISKLKKTMPKSETKSSDNVRLNKPIKHSTRSKEKCSKTVINNCKVIIVARRKKPVQLENSSASMTVLLTNNDTVNNST